MKNKNLSIIGAGFVGQAVYHTFSPYFNIKIYDKYKPGYNELEETVNNSKLIFIAVPTPMNSDGSQDKSSIYDAIESCIKYAKDRKIFIIKSTILPGTTKELKEKYPDYGFVFNPEFLTERTAIFDSINQYRIVLGSDDENDLNEVEEFYRVRFVHTLIFKTSFEISELIKYVNNCTFAVKVSTMNEIYNICKHLDVDYNEVRKIFLADGRIANSHTEVPGPDGDFGWGGKCYPKDIRAFMKWCEKNNIPSTMFDAAVEVNNRVRTNKDWLNITGATSENNYK